MEEEFMEREEINPDFLGDDFEEDIEELDLD